jgi:hypothetical protein
LLRLLPDICVMSASKPAPLHRHFATALLAWVVGAVACLPASSFASGGASKGGSGDTPFIAQTQIATSVLVSFRPVGVFQVDMGLYVPNQSQRARIISLQPVLRNAWRRTTQEFTNSYYVRGRVPDAVLLGERLQAATDEVLGAGSARVLLASVVVR